MSREETGLYPLVRGRALCAPSLLTLLPSPAQAQSLFSPPSLQGHEGQSTEQGRGSGCELSHPALLCGRVFSDPQSPCPTVWSGLL